MAVKRKNRKPRAVRRKSGHPFMVLFFFVALIMASAYMTDRMTNAPDSEAAKNVTAIGHIFNDKEMQGLVPSEDQGTPESVKEKIKAAMDKVVTVNVKADDETSAVRQSSDSQDRGNRKEDAKEKAAFSLPGVIAKITGKDKQTASEISGSPEGESAAAKKQDSLNKDSRSTSSSNEPVSRKEKERGAPSTRPPAAAPSSDKKPASSGTPEIKVLPAAAPKAPAPNSPSWVKGRLAVVIDDAGRDMESQHVYEGMGIPLTLAVMPNQVHTREAALSWHAHGLPLILHQPMESVSGIGMESEVILTSMSDEEIRNMLKKSLSQVPEAAGINNHQGSKATIDAHTMEAVMDELHHRHLFFFDSRTNSTTAADKAAASYGVPYVRNDLFVDNEADVAAISAMIAEGARRAEKYGSYVIIGHCRPKTAEAFRQMVPKLKEQGIQFVYVSSLAR